MRICIGSGGRFHAFDLAQQMNHLGHLTRLYTAYPRWKVDGLPREKVSTFPWLLVPSAALARVWGTRGWREINWRVIDTFGSWLARHLEACDILHCLSCFGLWAHRIARERYGAVTVCDRGSSHIVYQDQILAEEHSLWKVPYRPIDPRVVERELQEYEECHLIFVPSDFVYQTFVEKGIAREKLRLGPLLGVDLTLFRPVPKRDKTFRVIYAGQASLQKGIPYLLQAVEPLRLPDFELWLIGGVDREVKPILNRYQGLFRHLGFLPRTKLFSYYSQGSVFVIASVQEGLALVQAQAMACGLPVIATTNTGAASLFTDGKEGFIVPIRSPEAIREKILYLYEHPEVREAMAQAARERVQRLGGWEDYGNRMLSTYADALSARLRLTGVGCEA
jgi:glycosyltransferase involved in cell wall biosynthesis